MASWHQKNITDQNIWKCVPLIGEKRHKHINKNIREHTNMAMRVFVHKLWWIWILQAYFMNRSFLIWCLFSWMFKVIYVVRSAMQIFAVTKLIIVLNVCQNEFLHLSSCPAGGSKKPQNELQTPQRLACFPFSMFPQNMRDMTFFSDAALRIRVGYVTPDIT